MSHYSHTFFFTLSLYLLLSFLPRSTSLPSIGVTYSAPSPSSTSAGAGATPPSPATRTRRRRRTLHPQAHLPPPGGPRPGRHPHLPLHQRHPLPKRPQLPGPLDGLQPLRNPPLALRARGPVLPTRQDHHHLRRQRLPRRVPAIRRVPPPGHNEPPPLPPRPRHPQDRRLHLLLLRQRNLHALPSFLRAVPRTPRRQPHRTLAPVLEGHELLLLDQRLPLQSLQAQIRDSLRDRAVSRTRVQFQGRLDYWSQVQESFRYHD